MRIKQNGVERSGERVCFNFDGNDVEAYPGESIAAALICAQQIGFRETRDGKFRGLFCGMGVCGECSVLVDGQPKRACMEMAAAGIRVQRQPALRTLAGTAVMSRKKSDRIEQARDVEVLVIGAGPAGLAAGRAAALGGAKVLLVDERAKAGGQYFKQPGLGFNIDESQVDAQFREGATLYQSAADAGVEFCFGATVWGAFAGPEIAISTASGNQLITAKRIVLSSGAYERPVPFPGWTLPGVMTTGAAQTLLRAYQTAPGRRVLVAGNGPLNLQVARELDAAGATVVAVLELAPRPGLRNLGDLARMCVSSPSLVASGMGHMVRLVRSRVPLLYQHSVFAAHGDECVERVTVTKVDDQGRSVPGTELSFDVDAVCLGYGFMGQSEIARALDAEYPAFGRAKNAQTDLDDVGRSQTTPEMFVVGDVRGLGGARIALAQGGLAGAQAARDLGHSFGADRAGEMRSNQRLLRRHRLFQKGLWAVYAAPELRLSLAGRDTIICRCESVTRGQIEDVVATGVEAIGAIKRETRAGMGRCQGRYCAGLLADIAPASVGERSHVDENFAPRPPFKAQAIGDLATAYDPSVTFDRSAGAK